MVSRLTLSPRNLIGSFLTSTIIRANWGGITETRFNTILDIGAADGRSAKKFRKLWPLATIHCFEPQKEQFRQLRNNNLNDNKVKLYNYALTNKEGVSDSGYGKTSMYITQEYPRASSLLKPTNYTTKFEEVDLRTLDKWMELTFEEHEHLLEPILLKSDAQGHDLHVLEGGIKLLTKVKAIIIEIVLDEMFEGQSEFSDYVKFLKHLGFSYSGNIHQHVNKNNGHVKFIDALFIKS